MPRRGEEQPESITGFHHICEVTWSGKGGKRKTWRLEEVTCERRVEDIVCKTLIQELEPNVSLSPVANNILSFTGLEQRRG